MLASGIIDLILAAIILQACPALIAMALHAREIDRV